MFEEIIQDILDIATNSSGLCVIKVLIVRTTSKEERRLLLEKIVPNAISLS